MAFLDEILKRIKSVPQQVGSYFSPTTTAKDKFVSPVPTYNQPSNFWTSPVGQGLGKLQQKLEASRNLPKVNLSQYIPKVQTKSSIVNTAANLPINLLTGVGEGIVNAPIRAWEAGARVGYDATHQNEFKPSVSRLVHNLAPLATGMIDVAGIGVGRNIAKQALEQTAKKTLLKTVGKGALKGALYGGARNFSESASRPEIAQQNYNLSSTVNPTLEGAAGGAILGGALAGGGYAFGKVFQAFKKVSPGISDAEAKAEAKKYISKKAKDLVAPEKYTFPSDKKLKKTTFKETDPVHWKRVDEELGFKNGGPKGKDIPFGLRTKVLTDAEHNANLGKRLDEVMKPASNTGAKPDLQTPLSPETSPLSGIGIPELNPPGKPATLLKKTLSSPTSITGDVKNALTGAPVKERGFITSVKESNKTPQPLKDLVSGTYVVRSNKQLKTDALKLIKTDPIAAEKLALNPTSDVHVQIGNELINHYGSTGDFAKAKQIAEGMANSGTEFGQAVQAFSQYDKTTPSGALRFAQSKINEFNRLHPYKKLKVDDSQVKGIFDQAHQIQNMPAGRERNIAANNLMDQVNNLIPSTIVDKGIAVWKAGLLTSLRTSERNLLGNTVHGIAEVVKDPIASVADIGMSLKTGKRSMTTTLKGLGEFGSKKTGQQLADVMTKGYDPNEAITKFEVRHVTWGKNPVEQTLKKYTDVVFRALGAQDKPFYNAAFARSLYDQAGTEAINAGKRGDTAFIQNLVRQPTEQMLSVATKDASSAVFKDPNKLSSVASAIKREMSKSELGKLASEIVAPFTGVPSSIVGKTINYSPIGLVKGIFDAGRVVAGQVPELQRQAAQEIGRGVVGTGIFGLGAYLASKGLITSQPKDATEANQWVLEGKQANSMLVDGKWRSINSVGPEAIVMLAGAKLNEEMEKPDGSVGNYAFGLGKDQLNQTFLSGVQQPLNALTDPARYGKSYFGNQAASVIPNIVKDTSKAVDPYARKTNTVTDYLKAGTPGLRNTLLPKRDVLGNIIPQEPTGAGAFVDLFNSKTPITNSVVDELSRLNEAGANATPSKLQNGQTIKGVKKTLTPEELNSLEAQVGSQVTQALEQLIKSPDYQGLSDEDKAKAIDSTVSAVRKQVRGSINLSSSFPSTANPNPTVSGQQYTIIDANGSVRRIDLSKPISPPVLTGNTLLDKRLKSAYQSAITSRMNDLVKLYQDGQLSKEETARQLEMLNSAKGGQSASVSKALKTDLTAYTKLNQSLRSNKLSKSAITILQSIQSKSQPSPKSLQDVMSKRRKESRSQLLKVNK